MKVQIYDNSIGNLGYFINNNIKNTTGFIKPIISSVVGYMLGDGFISTSGGINLRFKFK